MIAAELVKLLTDVATRLAQGVLVAVSVTSIVLGLLLLVCYFIELARSK